VGGVVVIVVVVVVIATFAVAVAFVVRLNYWVWRLGYNSIISIVVVIIVIFFNVIGGGVVVRVVGNVDFSDVLGVVSDVVASVVGEMVASAATMSRREVVE
jgi:hypothetical protein